MITQGRETKSAYPFNLIVDSNEEGKQAGEASM